MSTPYMPEAEVEGVDIPDQVLYFSFNQDSTCIAVGTRRGFRIYQCLPLELISWADIGAVSIVEMQHISNLIVIVGHGDNYQLS
jgi:autophagy-related protein 18